MLRKEIKAVIVVADGFAERDEEGARLQNEIVEIAREAGIRIIGPNTAGIVNSANGLIPDPYEPGYKTVKPGCRSDLCPNRDDQPPGIPLC